MYFESSFLSVIHKEMEIDKNILGEEYGRVRFNLIENVHNPKYKIKNGDASFLDKGTILYAVKGYKPAFRLAAVAPAAYGGGIWIFEAEKNPRARRGSDLLDVEDKIDYIEIEGVEFRDENLIKEFENAVADSDIDQNYEEAYKNCYIITLYMKDKTIVERRYEAETGFINPGIFLPKEFNENFKDIIEKAFENKKF